MCNILGDETKGKDYMCVFIFDQHFSTFLCSAAALAMFYIVQAFEMV